MDRCRAAENELRSLDTSVEANKGNPVSPAPVLLIHCPGLDPQKENVLQCNRKAILEKAHATINIELLRRRSKRACLGNHVLHNPAHCQHIFSVYVGSSTSCIVVGI